MDKKELQEKAEKLMELREAGSAITKELEPIKEVLKTYVSKNGSKSENSKVIEVPSAKGIIQLTNIEKRTLAIKHGAVEHVKSKMTRRMQHSLLEEVVVLREDRAIALLEEDKLSPEDIEAIFSVTVTESFTPKYKK